MKKWFQAFAFKFNLYRYTSEDVGAQYALGDMSVLDVASLHWSKPRTVGNPPPERVGHATAVVPMRIHAAPSAQMTTPEPGQPPQEQEAGLCTS